MISKIYRKIILLSVVILLAGSICTHAGQVSYWWLDETSGLTAIDLVGGNDCELIDFSGDDLQWILGQTGGRGQCLIFKLNIGQRMGFTLNFGSARFPNKPP